MSDLNVSIELKLRSSIISDNKQSVSDNIPTPTSSSIVSATPETCRIWTFFPTWPAYTLLMAAIIVSSIMYFYRGLDIAMNYLALIFAIGSVVSANLKLFGKPKYNIAQKPFQYSMDVSANCLDLWWKTFGTPVIIWKIIANGYFGV